MVFNDDLDAFFDEVEEVEKEAKIESSHQPEQAASGNNSVERPSKKARINEGINDHEAAIGSTSSNNHPSNQAIGKGTVVVSKKATTIPAIHQNNFQTQQIYQITVPERLSSIPPPPPQPPLPHDEIPYHQYSSGFDKGNAKPSIRIVAGKKWVDPTLSDFPENDFRLFVGNLAKEVTEDKLAEAFQSKYESFTMARIIYDKISGVSKGYGFVSLMDSRDCARAIREMDQSWLGARPIKVKRSDWKEHDLRECRKNKKKKKRR